MQNNKVWENVLEEKLEPIVNPVRGWYGLNSFDLQEDCEVGSWMDEQPIQLLVINIGAYAEQDLPQKALDKVKHFIDVFANAQKDIILRLVYDQEGKGMEKEPGSFSRVIRHLEQLSPVLVQCKEKIWIFQGVLVGSWGEMHSSKFLSDEKYCQLEKQIYEIFGEEVFLAVRKPSYERIWKETGVERGKIAIFDDAILASETDLGTFSVEVQQEKKENDCWGREAELTYIQEKLAGVPNGGELVLDIKGEYRPQLSEIVETMRKMHITYLNRYYDNHFLQYLQEMTWEQEDAWQGKDGLSYVESHLGYRFCIRKVIFGENRIHIYLENTGFAVLTERAECWLQHEKDAPVLLSNQLHEWAGMIEISWEGNVLPGDYFIYMRCQKDGRILRFANWDNQDGKVLLGTVKKP